MMESKQLGLGFCLARNHVGSLVLYMWSEPREEVHQGFCLSERDFFYNA